MSNVIKEPQNPNLGSYWVGRIVDLEDQVENWDYEEAKDGLSKEFETKEEWKAWISKVGCLPVFITAINSPDDWVVEYTHFYWTFADGTTMEAPCGICVDKSGFGKGRQIPMHMVDEIDRYNDYIKYPKNENLTK